MAKLKKYYHYSGQATHKELQNLKLPLYGTMMDPRIKILLFINCHSINKIFQIFIKNKKNNSTNQICTILISYNIQIIFKSLMIRWNMIMVKQLSSKKLFKFRIQFKWANYYKTKKLINIIVTMIQSNKKIQIT